MPPDAALRALQEGNERYVAGTPEFRTHSPLGDRHDQGQHPLAAIIACADSRVSPTLIFDLDRGNLFVSRIAGNTIDPGVLGSTEYAVAVLGVKLVMVLGHTGCGAVEAAIEVADGTASYAGADYGSIGSVVEPVVASVESLPPEERTLSNCVTANARLQAAELAAKHPVIGPAVEAGRVSVVAAVCEIETGRVKLI
jgi:carbonic anhydrase